MNDLVISLACKFIKLQVLSLRQINPQLEDSGVEAVANCCPDLRELDLSRSFRLSDRSLFALSHGCPHLTRLNISGCSNFSDTALVYLTSQCTNFKFLNLCGCVRTASDRALQVLHLLRHYFHQPVLIATILVQAIALNCGQLQSLNLGWCDSITDKGGTSLASGCPELRALDLCGCVLITGNVQYWRVGPDILQSFVFFFLSRTRRRCAKPCCLHAASVNNISGMALLKSLFLL
jgi:F-box and leucine-rich repeat protein 1 (S-phase kinase-associated protein 2)